MSDQREIYDMDQRLKSAIRRNCTCCNGHSVVLVSYWKRVEYYSYGEDKKTVMRLAGRRVAGCPECNGFSKNFCYTYAPINDCQIQDCTMEVFAGWKPLPLDVQQIVDHGLEDTPGQLFHRTRIEEHPSEVQAIVNEVLVDLAKEHGISPRLVADKDRDVCSVDFNVTEINYLSGSREFSLPVALRSKLEDLDLMDDFVEKLRTELCQCDVWGIFEPESQDAEVSESNIEVNLQ